MSSKIAHSPNHVNTYATCGVDHEEGVFYLRTISRVADRHDNFPLQYLEISQDTAERIIAAAITLHGSLDVTRSVCDTRLTIEWPTTAVSLPTAGDALAATLFAGERATVNAEVR